MSSNLIKYNSFICEESERRVIDSNELIAERMGHLSRLLNSVKTESAKETAFVGGFTEGLNPLQVERLLSDSDSIEESSIMKAEQAASEGLIEQANSQIDEMLAKANEQAEQIIQEASGQANMLRTQAEEEGRKTGYAEGYQEALAAFTEKEAQLSQQREQLQREYEEKIEEIEPQMIEMLTDIYEHIFRVKLCEQKEMIVHLLQNTLSSTESLKEYLIHISREDYSYVSTHKDELQSVVTANSHLELIEDALLSQGQCMIETAGGIFDCSLSTELEGLKKELRLLSYEKTVL